MIAALLAVPVLAIGGGVWWWLSRRDKDPPELGYGAKTIYGYGRVNFANLDWKKTEAEIRYCAKAGVKAYIWECDGWGQEVIWGYAGRVKQACEVAGNIVKLCRQLGIWAIPSITNYNITMSKYGRKGRPLATFLHEAQAIVETFKRLGPKNLAVQIVAENDGDNGEWNAFINWAAAQLSGFALVDNTESRTLVRRPWAKYRAWHGEGVARLPGGVLKDCLAISDHGTLIRQLAIDGSLDGAGSPAQLRTWARNSSGCALIGYYAFWYDGDIDKQAIKALGDLGK